MASSSPPVYLITNCAACAAPLAHNAPRCVRCFTRYCDSTCQQDHWRRGHKQICKKIHRGGNAEQYYADKKYKEAVAVAVKACADDMKGHRCYICLEAVHPRTGEGLVRGCGCGDHERYIGSVPTGATGAAHVSCLVEQAKVLLAEAEENNLEFQQRWRPWWKCSLCEQGYHSVVRCALGWAAWKTYLGLPEGVHPRTLKSVAVEMLAIGLKINDRWEDLLDACKCALPLIREEDPIPPEAVLGFLRDMRLCYAKLGRTDEELGTLIEIFNEACNFYEITDQRTLEAAADLSKRLLYHRRCHKAKIFLCDAVVAAEEALGDEHRVTVDLKKCYALALYQYHFYGYDDYRDDLRKSIEIIEDLLKLSTRVNGKDHGETQYYLDNLATVREEQLDWCIHDLTPATFRAYRDS